MLHALLEQGGTKYNNINQNIITPVYEEN